MNIITKSFQMAFDSFLDRASTQGSSQTAKKSEFSGYIGKIKRRRKIKRGIGELSVLSNHVLNDIGIERGNIPALVEELTDQSVNSSSTGVRSIGSRPLDDDFAVEGSAA